MPVMKNNFSEGLTMEVSIYLGFITMFLIIAHVFLAIKWNLKDPVKTHRLMWLAMVIVFLQILSGTWFISIFAWIGVAIFYDWMTVTNWRRIEAEQKYGKQ